MSKFCIGKFNLLNFFHKKKEKFQHISEGKPLQYSQDLSKKSELYMIKNNLRFYAEVYAESY